MTWHISLEAAPFFDLLIFSFLKISGNVRFFESSNSQREEEEQRKWRLTTDGRVSRRTKIVHRSLAVTVLRRCEVPHYSVLSQNLLQEIFESMGQFVDGLKFSGGSNSLIPKSFIKQAIEMAHEHGVYVSTGDWAEHMLRSGPSAFKDYVEECKQLGFDTIELNANSLEVPEETLLRYVRLIKSGGLRAKPMFAVKFNKSDIPGRNRAFGSYVVPEPRSSEFVEDIDLLIRKAERCLEAGADTIMIDADDVCKYPDSLRADIIAKVIGRLGIEKTMFEASDGKLAEWFIERYGPNVNLYVDHSQIMDLECLRGRHLAFGFVFIMNGKLSSGTTPHEADPPQASNLAFSPEAAPPDTSAMDDDSDINYEPVPPFVPEFPVFIFYLGERKHDDPNLVTQSHLEILKSVLGSEEAANKSVGLQLSPWVFWLCSEAQTSRGREIEKYCLLHETNMGSGAIIGVIDSGIWPESGAFDDDGYGPIPKQWKGQCVSADQFSPVDCNKKLIGAKYYIDGLNADLETSINSTIEYLSPRDRNGHGTQVSSTVAGSFVSNVTLPGLSSGSIMRGGAPKAHIAMYKACWDVEGGMCSVADLVTGGSRYSSVINISPWILTVAATTLDRSFPTLITLENNKTFLGQSLYTGPEISFTDLICTADHSNLDQITKGKVIMHFSMGPTPPMTPDIVQENGGIGLIDVRSPSDSRVECPANFPCIYVDLEVGSELYTYIPNYEISPYKTIIGERVASKVAKSSARGPSSFSPAILKPDIAAPGIVALLKISHPNWSPAAIKSALVTTAMKTDPYGERLTVDGGNYKEADAFDYGGALYTDKKVSALTGNVTSKCPSSGSSILDLNVPSITIPDLKRNVTVTRSVTNVGPVKSVYKPVIETPLGFKVVVSPKKLKFNKRRNKVAFKIYIVHLGVRQHDDSELVSESHQRMLESVFESEEAARDSIVYNYHHGFSGFAARLTDSQAKQLSDRPDVFSVTPNRKVQLQSTRVYDYLGLPPSFPSGILHESNMGSDLVIGFLDSGVWPESPAFNDEGLGPIPKHWKGKCVAGEGFDPAKHCNKKLVGAKYFTDDWDEKNPGNPITEDEFMSPRGLIGHGTMVSSIAASSFVPNASYGGLAPGLMRGGAPKARIAMYKVAWDSVTMGSTTANMVKAFDEAINDGVDVLSISLASVAPFRPIDAITEDLELGSFHAVTKGIPVIAGGSNTGPDAYTVANGAPWLLTVAATNVDRTFYADMTFGNNITIMGQAQHTGKEVSAGLVYIEDYKNDISSVPGKVVLTFVKEDWEMTSALAATTTNNAVGLIVARSGDHQSDIVYSQPFIYVDYEVGAKILRYIHSSSSPTVKISTGKTLVGRPIATQVCGFSSRGPNPISPAILKPDIAAPGVTILGATAEDSPGSFGGYFLGTGTSYATPVVAGLVVLLKALHPDWSPAALKSAIMTTAWKTDPSGEPIFAEGEPRKLADPFDYGAGLVNVERAKDPGLVYDMNLDDYIHYFCVTGYNDTAITLITGKPTKCSSPLPSILDLNYPAITIPDLEEEVTVTRTVTNVGPVDSVYRAVVEPPRGVTIVVEPETLVFCSNTKKLEFKVRVSSSHKSNTGFIFGSFTWTDGTRNVTIPLSVRTRVLNP
ncbi:unnamed protein product [Arabidopsis arenosa]|uniref:Subtilase family protein n=1 Tax=Arabidopsis arenosa TaxID=38785 RepID=A0A8S2AR12_ARAAE|nr:unnamed protein product [Arabidopsis arenosa]